MRREIDVSHPLAWLLVTVLAGALLGAIYYPVFSSPTLVAIAGRVVDSQRSPLPGVHVTATPEAGGESFRTVTGTDGAYQFERLTSSAYRVDFDLAGFDLVRRNHVQAKPDATARIDADLRPTMICNCIVPPDSGAEDLVLRTVTGQVVDTSNHGLPHARLEVTASIGRDDAFADEDGRFVVRLPANQPSQLRASDSGFQPMTVQVSGNTASPIVIRLTADKTTSLSDTELLARGCGCGELFVHAGR